MGFTHLETAYRLTLPVPAVRYLGNQGDVEIRWAPVSHVILAFNMGRFKPGRFLDNVSYNRGPIVCNIGLTYRF